MAEVMEFLKSIPYLTEMPSKSMWVDYDDEANVLYISFRKPQHADDSKIDDDIIYHYSGKELVGITIVNAKKK